MGNYWIRHLMGNTPWDTSSYMKVIPGSSDPASQMRWYCQRDCCQRLCLFKKKEKEKKRILSHQYESMVWSFYNRLIQKMLHAIRNLFVLPLYCNYCGQIFNFDTAFLYLSFYPNSFMFGPLWRSLENILVCHIICNLLITI